MKRWTIVLVAVVMLVSVGQVYGSIEVGILAGDGNSPEAELMATGRFSSVSTITIHNQTPTLAQLSVFDVACLAYTNAPPDDAVALGNVLADYVDAGGRVVLSTYSFSTYWNVTGRITTSGYSPLTNVGVNGDVSGNLVATVPGDVIFYGVDLASVTYYHNANFAHPGLDAGATLLATDGAGHNMIARNAAGNVIGLNLFPASFSGNNAEFFELVANTLKPIPEPSSLIVWSLLAGLGIAVGWHRRRKAA